MKSAFLVSKGLLRSYDKQNNTWLLVDMEFFYLCSTRLLTRELLSEILEATLTFSKFLVVGHSW